MSGDAGPGDAVICRPLPGDDVADRLSAARESGASVFVLVSTARVYGADPGNDMELDEGAPMREPSADPALAEVVEADQYCCEAAEDDTGTRIVVLRPVHVLGPDSDGPLARYLRASRVRARFGFDPFLQVMHDDDVDAAVEAAVRSDVSGPFNVAGDGGLPLSVLAGEVGASRITGPTGVLVDLLGGVGIDLTARMDERDLRYVLSVDDGRFRSASGYSPKRTLGETVASMKAVPDQKPLSDQETT